MNYNQFSNLSCYEEFEIKSSLTGFSKVDVLREIGHQINDYYFFVSNDGIFNWYDLEGNHIENPGVLKELRSEHIPKNISECIIPDGVTSIGEGAFSYCESLQSITLPNNVISIGNDAFYDCNSLKEIIIPDSVTCIGNWVFSLCKSLQSITIPNGVKYIGNGSFSHCESLTSITLPDKVTSIGVDAFYCCESLKEIIIPDSVTSIGYGTFSFCDSLKEIIFKGKTLEEVKRMEYYPFGIKDESIIKVSEMI